MRYKTIEQISLVAQKPDLNKDFLVPSNKTLVRKKMTESTVLKIFFSFAHMQYMCK